jgi:hypothetical protein
VAEFGAGASQIAFYFALLPGGAVFPPLQQRTIVNDAGKPSQMAEEKDDQFRYQVRLLIKHPDIDPAHITNTLGVIPNISAIAGSTRKTPVGTILAGLHKVSLWSHSFDVKGNRWFFSAVAEMIDKLEPQKTFLTEIADTGGSIELIVNLPGAVSIGDVFPWHDMARLCAMRINLGIEVFPEFD